MMLLLERQVKHEQVKRELEFSITVGKAHGNLDVGRIKERLQRWLDHNCIVVFLQLSVATT